jgi:exodeoxyribonuclease VII small subunit
MAKKKNSDEPITFEQSLESLEQIVRQLEDGQLGLSDSLARYEEGVGHLKHCHKTLAAAERKIELLTAVDEGGNATTEAFDEDSDAGAKKKTRSSRRSKPAKGEETDDIDTQRGLF